MSTYTLAVINEAPESTLIEDAARWIQWAMYAMTTGGAIEEESTIRYNLSQWWDAKAAAYPSQTVDGQQQLDRLDIRAHGLLTALDMARTVADTPSYWEFWKSFLFGGTPDNPHAAEDAAQAAVDAEGMKQSAIASGEKTWVDYAENQKRVAAQNLQMAKEFWTQKGVINSGPLGVPWWVWGLGVVGVVGWLNGSFRSRR